MIVIGWRSSNLLMVDSPLSSASRENSTASPQDDILLKDESQEGGSHLNSSQDVVQEDVEK